MFRLPSPSLLLFPQHLPWWMQSSCRCKQRRQAGRTVLGQDEGPAGPWQGYTCLPWTRVQYSFQGQKRPRPQFPSLHDSEQRCEPRTLFQAVSHWQGVMILATLCITLSCQINSIFYQTQTCTQQEKRKKAVPLKWLIPESPISQKSNQDTWGRR